MAAAAKRLEKPVLLNFGESPGASWTNLIQLSKSRI
jgi:hypothetical protein